MGRVIVAFSAAPIRPTWRGPPTTCSSQRRRRHRRLGLASRIHKRDAEAFVQRFGIVHEYVRTTEFDNPDYARNDPNRCFHCKDELFTRLEQVGRARGCWHVVYGVNADDLTDYRPAKTPPSSTRWPPRWPTPA